MAIFSIKYAGTVGKVHATYSFSETKFKKRVGAEKITCKYVINVNFDLDIDK